MHLIMPSLVVALLSEIVELMLIVYLFHPNNVELNEKSMDLSKVNQRDDGTLLNP